MRSLTTAYALSLKGEKSPQMLFFFPNNEESYLGKCLEMTS